MVFSVPPPHSMRRYRRASHRRLTRDDFRFNAAMVIQKVYLTKNKV
jgi:hypothetical protein